MTKKRIDLLLKAALIINSSVNTRCRVLLTQGTDTVEVVNEIFDNHIPNWVEIIPQSNNILSIFEMADCFVSTSVHETFSYAICEASVYGLPIIQSDISGTEWNLHNPSTFSFKSLDVEDLHRAMLAVMSNDSSDLQEKCLETRKRNLAEYDIQNWCKHIINFYNTI